MFPFNSINFVMNISLSNQVNMAFYGLSIYLVYFVTHITIKTICNSLNILFQHKKNIVYLDM